MSESIIAGGYDAIIHSAAVSDFLSAGVYGPAEDTHFDAASAQWRGDPPRMLDRRAGKVKSSEPELWLRLVRAPKLVDLVRGEWGFRGVLVKFKLEVDVTEERLLRIAEESRRQSGADLMVANTLDGAAEWAFLGPLDAKYERLTRPDLSPRLLDAVERLHASRTP
jgi:phosphopantothenoylcysteine synthetase/decarboxylase